MYEAARVRTIVSAHQDFVVRYNIFKGRYNCIPGDCANATQFFAGTVSGDGNGWVRWSAPNEALYFWNHMHHAGLAAGYIPRNGSSSYLDHYMLHPAYKQSGRWFVGSLTFPNAALYTSTLPALRGIGLQSAQLNSNPPGASVLVAVESVLNTYNIDTKMDDGRPGTGKFFAGNGYEFGTSVYLPCIIGSLGASAVYDMNQEGINCRYVFQVDQ